MGYKKIYLTERGLSCTNEDRIRRGLTQYPI